MTVTKRQRSSVPRPVSRLARQVNWKRRPAASRPLSIARGARLLLMLYWKLRRPPSTRVLENASGVALPLRRRNTFLTHLSAVDSRTWRPRPASPSCGACQRSPGRIARSNLLLLLATRRRPKRPRVYYQSTSPRRGRPGPRIPVLLRTLSRATECSCSRGSRLHLSLG